MHRRVGAQPAQRGLDLLAARVGAEVHDVAGDPHLRGRPAIDRTYQAVDSSVVATTTASRGGRPAAVRAAADADTRARISAGELRPGQPDARGRRLGTGGHRASSARTAAVSLSARSARRSTEFAAARSSARAAVPEIPAEVDLDVDPGGRRGRAGGLGSRGHVADHVAVADREQVLGEVEDPGHQPDESLRRPGGTERGGLDRGGALRRLPVVALRQAVRLGHRRERRDVVLGEGERLVAQPVRGVADLVHQLGVLGEAGAVAVPRDHGDECRGLGGVQRRGRSAPGCGHPVGQRRAGSCRSCRCARCALPLMPGPVGCRASGRILISTGQRRIRAMSGSTSGSVATVAGMRRPKYSISTRRAGGRARRQPRVGDGPADGVPEGGAGDVPRRLPVEEHRLVAEDDALAVVDGEAGQPAGDGVGRHRRRWPTGRRTRPCPAARRSRARPRTGCARWSCRGPRRGSPSPGAGC